MSALLALLLCVLLLSPPHQQGGAALPEQQQRQVGEEQAAIRQALASQRHAEQQGAQHSGYLPEPAPRVALLFLVRGHMPLEPLWQAFFETAAQVGAARAAAAACARLFGVVALHWQHPLLLARQPLSLCSRRSGTAEWVGDCALPRPAVPAD